MSQRVEENEKSSVKSEERKTKRQDSFRKKMAIGVIYFLNIVGGGEASNRKINPHLRK